MIARLRYLGELVLAAIAGSVAGALLLTILQRGAP